MHIKVTVNDMSIYTIPEKFHIIIQKYYSNRGNGRKEVCIYCI